MRLGVGGRRVAADRPAPERQMKRFKSKRQRSKVSLAYYFIMAFAPRWHRYPPDLSAIRSSALSGVGQGEVAKTTGQATNSTPTKSNLVRYRLSGLNVTMPYDSTPTLVGRRLTRPLPDTAPCA